MMIYSQKFRIQLALWTNLWRYSDTSDWPLHS